MRVQTAVEERRRKKNEADIQVRPEMPLQSWWVSRCCEAADIQLNVTIAARQTQSYNSSSCEGDAAARREGGGRIRCGRRGISGGTGTSELSEWVWWMGVDVPVGAVFL
jgi:hypothetical protein